MRFYPVLIHSSICASQRNKNAAAKRFKSIEDPLDPFCYTPKWLLGDLAIGMAHEQNSWIRKSFNAKFKLQLPSNLGMVGIFMSRMTLVCYEIKAALTFLKDLKIAQHDGTKVGKLKNLLDSLGIRI